ncbi:glycine zipper 2TM domain-containing protein [Aeromonas sanarellii]|uniref:Glycine zipper 2TM domain-containing protein n=1 Tax=Aeromonas sanarellii TaxID=633415 RepID=A0ABS4B1B8_9GAMM|nr:MULTISPECIES: glycine zipper 2TM domain-containing protein [Aeromonas]MBP0601274.1 glycine zipper 2TM domain-containing protein [Aeromonas sanarellii]QXC29271.1 glycine zipper 2TM domain-containing protein [Aeromonas sp. FDAARGOS 1409]WOX50009.1 glycine zipper 2TM domain-containing protein [Aeromonas sp. XH]
MKAIILIVSSLLGFVTAPAWGAVYERNTARPVEQVVFGQVDTVRNITQRQVVESEHTGWKTLGGAVLGGLLGNQFGGGHGREIATAVGALAGAAAVQHYQSGGSVVENKLVELLIRSDQDRLINVIQDYDPAMVFAQGDKVRILYFNDGVRVDKTY